MSDYIISPLCHIINGFISEGTFPTEWKIARISPIPKVKSPSELVDYRPISVLPILSKVYERVILHQLLEYIETLYKNTQHGFRKSRSTVTCLLKLRDDILKAMSRGEVTVAVFADYSKAFDTIDYATLLRKLEKLNFSKDFLHWLTEYIADRKHFVQIDDNSSSMRNTGFGVPQGSILGPVIFNLYFIDLPNHLNVSGLLQYADDTTVYDHCKATQVAEKTGELVKDLQNLISWSTNSNLVFNNKKTKTMLFSTRQLSRTHNIKNADTKLTCNGHLLESSEELRVLGVTFNQHLDWKMRRKKLLRYTQIIEAHKATATIFSKKTTCLSWTMATRCTSARLQRIYLRLQKVQNAAAGFVLQRHAKIADVIKLSWLPVLERYKYAIAVLAFKALHEIVPDNMQVKRKINHRTLRTNTNNTGTMIDCNDSVTTFQAEAKTVFNDLPKIYQSKKGIFCN